MYEVKLSKLEEILPFRGQFLQENNCQIRYNACHERGWSDSYLLAFDGKPVGYGSVKGKDALADRNAIFEFYLLPHYRKKAAFFYKTLIEVAEVQFLECQTNDFFHIAMVFEFGKNIRSDTVLFDERVTTDLVQQNSQVRLREEADLVFERNKAAGAYVMIKEKEVVASAGFLLHYNLPFADLYMEVRSDCRRQGYGAFILQEVKKYCYAANRIPAARCSIKNPASKATLIKAGLGVCGFMLVGKIQ